MAKKEEEKEHGAARHSEHGKSETAKREEAVLAFWQKNKIFEKSVEKEAPQGNYVFYDGPPFATGLPHYGHILISVIKDAVPRYFTMKGYRVRRRWGWDCHGLPIENIVEKEIGISGKKQIEETGLERFNETARTQVLTFVSEWKKTIDRVGRWVDFENSYKTMDNAFIESVWWACKEVHKKGLLYEGTKVLPYCPRCETPIANAEIAMDQSYKDITDLSVYVKFPLAGKENTYFLVWTTTPWTLPGNTALAVNPEEMYVKVAAGDEHYILAKERVGEVFEGGAAVTESLTGKELVGREYEPPFAHFKNTDAKNSKNGWKVCAADFVTTEEGTGMVHIAPAFGEDDMRLREEYKLPVAVHVGPDGKFSVEFGEKEYGVSFLGRPVKPKESHQESDVLIIKNLHAKGLLLKKEKVAHAYPHCHRCETPLYYYAIPAWFVNIQKKKKEILALNEKINWIPAHLKHGRFGKSVEGAPDWNVSRNRYWASPLPIWKSGGGTETTVIGSLEELKERAVRNRYVVMRHGEAVNNRDGVVSARPDNPHPLTEKGAAHVEVRAKELKKKIKHVDVIYASDFLRTKETAERVADALGCPREKIRFDERIREIDTGEFNLRPVAEYRAYFSSQREKFVKRPPGGENIHDVKLRTGAFLYDIDKEHEGKTVLIVTHEYLVWMLDAVAAGLTDDEAAKRPTDRDYIENGEWRELPFAEIPHNADYELDYHRPYVDRVRLRGKNGEALVRIPEVIDCWFESAAMPFAAVHYPFENEKWFHAHFPAQFIAEYIAQTRTWFYYTHALSAILFESIAFENVLTTGTILAEDGSKMSKSKGNFPDPLDMIETYGADALRFYLLSSPLLKSEDLNFSEEGVRDAQRKIVARLRNVCAFYQLYKTDDGKEEKESNHVLDGWIEASLNETIRCVGEAMELYAIDTALRCVTEFLEDLSLWYVRRSRERFKSGTEDAHYARSTLRSVLERTACILAPFIPFAAEDVYQEVKRDGSPESVHLRPWPEVRSTDVAVLETMKRLRGLVSRGMTTRSEAGIKVRQPLARAYLKEMFPEPCLALMRDELNVKEVVHDPRMDEDIRLDIAISEELKCEGALRELIRHAQGERKRMGLRPRDTARLVLSVPDSMRAYLEKQEETLRRAVGAADVVFEEGEPGGIEFESGDAVYRIKIEAL